MDTRQFTESEYLTVQVVRESPTKKLVITSAGTAKPDDKGRQRWQCAVEIDNVAKLYRPNKETMKAMQKVWGYDSLTYIGKALTLTVGRLGSYEAVIGTPV